MYHCCVAVCCVVLRVVAMNAIDYHVCPVNYKQSLLKWEAVTSGASMSQLHRVHYELEHATTITGQMPMCRNNNKDMFPRDKCVY